MGWLSRWLQRRRLRQLEKDLSKEADKARARTWSPAALVDGRHYATYPDTVKRLKREGKVDEAEALLWRLVAATEGESADLGHAVAPWYYVQLAIIARQRKDYGAEVAVLERYQGKRRHGHDMRPDIEERLQRARQLLAASEESQGAWPGAPMGMEEE